MKYYPFKQNDIMEFTGTWMELENINFSEVTQTQKVKYGIYLLLSRY